jgi:hypothetical protein
MPGDGVEPRPQLAGIAQCRKVHGGHAKRLLDAIGRITFTHHADAKVVEPGGVAVIDPGERRRMACCGSVDQLGVGHDVPVELSRYRHGSPHSASSAPYPGVGGPVDRGHARLQLLSRSRLLIGSRGLSVGTSDGPSVIRGVVGCGIGEGRVIAVERPTVRVLLWTQTAQYIEFRVPRAVVRLPGLAGPPQLACGWILGRRVPALPAVIRRNPLAASDIRPVMHSIDWTREARIALRDWPGQEQPHNR